MRHVVRDGLELLRPPQVRLSDLARVWPEVADLRRDGAEPLQIEAHDAAYLRHQGDDMAAFRAEEALLLPRDLESAGVPGLGAEIRARLTQLRPPTLGAAARLPGMTLAALTLLDRYARPAA